jgi:hypothetical protein
MGSRLVKTPYLGNYDALLKMFPNPPKLMLCGCKNLIRLLQGATPIECLVEDEDEGAELQTRFRSELDRACACGFAIA